ncbi:MAG TPA: hypothetical protein VN604_08135 [Nitrospirota bacterium]|nr:hypothetical protein [Nitrospirota bacterium]
MKRTTTKDLFGKAIRERRPKYEVAVERADKRSVPFRAARIRWLTQVIPKNMGFMMPMETFYVFEEAKASYVYGNFVAAIILAASFVEHWFAAGLGMRGYEKEASRGLAASIKVAREKNLVDPALLNMVDRLRLIRNPFVHLKPFEHKHNIGQRSLKQRIHPEAKLESDAQEALITMYGVAVYAFGKS